MRILHNTAIRQWEALSDLQVQISSHGKWFAMQTWADPHTGKSMEFSLIGQPDWAVILIRLSSGEFIITEEFNQGVNGIRLGLPGGTLEDKENPEKGVKRELIEECGIHLAKNPIFLGTAEPIMRNSPVQYHMFFAETDTVIQEQTCDLGEYIRVFAVSSSELLRLVKTNRITSSSARDCILTAQLEQFI